MQQNESEFPIRIGDLRKAFGAQRVLNGITLEVARGETVAVVGRSGGGKSVLLKLIIGLQRADAGSIQLAGREITKLEEEALNEVRKRIGFLFQQAALYDSLTVQDNVAFPLSRHTKMSPEERNQRVHELLADVGMDRDRQKMPSEISGGMQKRVGLARALALDPEILLFDEPTAGLDPITAVEIGDLIVDLKRKRPMSAIVVTHDVHGSKAYCDRMVLLHEGNIVAQGSFDELQSSGDEFVARFFRYGSG
ncbi:MAG TPA: ATP-binding cassette domain-containing protein [Terriglobales bacterium]|nr:ATP-binding cassette domain-containing protein [Terriglobales bacterium]